MASAHHRPSPRKRPHAATAAAADAAAASNLASTTPAAPHISQLHRQQLAKVVNALAPRVVLEQHLTVPGAPAGNLSAALADSAPLLPLSVLRACVNEACTSALLSSAMALDAPSEQDSARLLNDVDRFQSAILSVLDQLEFAYRREMVDTTTTTADVKSEPVSTPDLTTTTAAAHPPPPAKIQRYMLHRTLPTGVDVFTSAAVLSDQDLEALAEIEDTDVIAVHPSASSSSSISLYALDPTLSANVDAVPVPSLGQANPRPAGWQQSARNVAPVARVGAAPGLYGAEAALRKDPRFMDPLNPARRPTVLLRYASPFLSSLAPTHDSTGATEPYTSSASRALSQLRSRRWIDASLDPDDDGTAGTTTPPPLVALTEAEEATLRELGVDIEAFLEGANSTAGSDPTAVAGTKPTRLPAAAVAAAASPRANPPPAGSAADAAKGVWTALERNADLIVRVARAQVARTRTSYDAELHRVRKRAAAAAEAQQQRAVRAGLQGTEPSKGLGTGTGREEGVGAEVEVVERAGRAELKDAEALLDSLVALIASLPSNPSSPKSDNTSHATTTATAAVVVVPPRAFLSKLAPLLLAARQKEPSFRGTLDPVNDRALKLRESAAALPPPPRPGTDIGGGLQLGGGGGGGEMDLKVF
ncbi:hypothetical protein JCM3774_003391 [Rhodotorula dairenensis]